MNITFDDNTLLPLLFGEHNAHLKFLETMLNVDISSRGNTVSIKGQTKAMQVAEAVLDMMWSKLEKDEDVSISDFNSALRFARGERAGFQTKARKNCVIVFWIKKQRLKPVPVPRP